MDGTLEPFSVDDDSPLLDADRIFAETLVKLDEAVLDYMSREHDYNAGRCKLTARAFDAALLQVIDAARNARRSLVFVRDTTEGGHC